MSRFYRIKQIYSSLVKAENPLIKTFRKHSKEIKVFAKLASTVSGTIGGSLYTVDYMIKLNNGPIKEKIDGLEKRIDEKVDGIERRMDEKVDGLKEKVDGLEKGMKKR
ncbi:hypothetical protein C1645_807112 [Glomus cerebriforme]|uniref:Uncharacterized protein n=1 Tax=Glomus cerebriforme TaxID=658196 RepID=A0A397SNV9_9GLOM|nr:hypothetical protein C1645_807112 [Glomus cerebriforme]